MSIRTNAAIVVQFVLRRMGGCAVQAVAALFAYQDALQQGGLKWCAAANDVCSFPTAPAPERTSPHSPEPVPGSLPTPREDAHDHQRRDSARPSVDGEGV